MQCECQGLITFDVVDGFLLVPGDVYLLYNRTVVDR